MAKIYQKLPGDNTLILDPREYMMRPFDLGANWTEVRMGVFYTPVTSAGDNVSALNEVVGINNNLDWLAFGIKDSATVNLPGTAGGSFLGMIMGPGQANIQVIQLPTGVFAQPASAMRLIGYNGAASVGTNNDAAGGLGLFWPDASAANGYNSFWGMRFVIANLGLATQTVSLYWASAIVAGVDYSVNNLRTYLNNTAYNNFNGTPAVPWNTGAAALPIPDAFFVRLPFFNNRCRMSAMEIIRYA